MGRPRVSALAGPNGAGRTTVAKSLVHDEHRRWCSDNQQWAPRLVAEGRADRLVVRDPVTWQEACR